MDASEGFHFPKAEHLKSRKQIDELFGKGKSFFIHPIKVYWHAVAIETGGVATVKVGVSASKRNFKRAVDRNRLKRLLRETYRLNKNQLLELALGNNYSLQVFFIYVDKTLPTFDNLEAKMKACLHKLEKIVGDRS